MTVRRLDAALQQLAASTEDVFDLANIATWRVLKQRTEDALQAVNVAARDMLDAAFRCANQQQGLFSEWVFDVWATPTGTCAGTLPLCCFRRCMRRAAGCLRTAAGHFCCGPPPRCACVGTGGCSYPPTTTSAGACVCPGCNVVAEKVVNVLHGNAHHRRWLRLTACWQPRAPRPPRPRPPPLQPPSGGCAVCGRARGRTGSDV